MRRVAFAVPGDLATPTGGYAYDRRMIAELEKLGWTVEVIDLGNGFPSPDDETKAAAHRLLLAVPEGQIIVVDGLALGVLPEAARELRERNPLVALVHHPLALETGLPAAKAKDLRASERSALAAVRRVIVTSTATARELTANYAVAPDHLTVARPGSDPVPVAVGSSNGMVRLLSVGAVVPRKGFDVLIAALATLVDLSWQLTIAGDRRRDPQAAEQLNADIARFGLTDRVKILGALPSEILSAFYAKADLFVLASRYEGYGMAFAEAIAHGLPVIGTTAGAIPDTVPIGTGVLVAPDNIESLALALRRIVENPDERLRLAKAARAAASQLPTWQDSAKIFSRALEALA